MEIGVDSFVAATLDPARGRAVDPARDLRHCLEAIVRADEVGLDAFGIGEHHRREYLDSAPAMILAAADGPHAPHPTHQRRHGVERRRSGPRAVGRP